nr:MAG TPA: hypothetical protein [Caudoviricetes sp.]
MTISPSKSDIYSHTFENYTYLCLKIDIFIILKQ